MQSAFVAAAIGDLVSECFLGDEGTAHFTGEGEGRAIFATLAGLDAAAASCRLSLGTNSVVAHVRHLVEAMRGSNGWAATGKFSADFDGAWEEQTATQERWRELQSELRRELEIMRGWLSDGERLTADNVHWTLSVLAHCAYHLGSIRQLAALARL